APGHRLTRAGDRPLNRALHTVVLHRRHHDPATREYIAGRTAEGLSRREATRLLKRYVARHLYRLLQNQGPLLVCQAIVAAFPNAGPRFVATPRVRFSWRARG